MKEDQVMNKDEKNVIEKKSDKNIDLEKETVEDLNHQLEQMNKKNEDYKNQLMYLQADFQNYRKQVEKEFQEQRKFGQKEMVKLLIEIKEDVERSTENMNNNTEIYKGMLLISNNIDIMLKEQGVEEIESMDKQFDPNLHQVVSSKEDAKREENTISSEIRIGYKIHGVLLRPSLVEVIKNNKKEE